MAKGTLFSLLLVIRTTTRVALGRSYGSVHKAVHLQTGDMVAIKIIPMGLEEGNIDQVSASSARPPVWRTRRSVWLKVTKEVNIMKQCDCANIVKFFGCYAVGTDLWVIR